jgi:hypothetical protein
VSLRAAAALAAAFLALAAADGAGAQTQAPRPPAAQPAAPARPAPPAPPPAPAKPTMAVLQGLDKITARVSTFKAPLGQSVRFGTLEVQAKACDKRPPEEPPESAAYLEIRELRPGEQPARIFAGWMFASSPALSALEHPVYDVWVVDCQ